MWENLFRHIDIQPQNANLLDGNASDLAVECKRYEDKIKCARECRDATWVWAWHGGGCHHHPQGGGSRRAACGQPPASSAAPTIACRGRS